MGISIWQNNTNDYYYLHNICWRIIIKYNTVIYDKKNRIIIINNNGKNYILAIELPVVKFIYLFFFLL